METTYLKNNVTPFRKVYEWVKITEKNVITIWDNKVEIEDLDETIEECVEWHTDKLDMCECTQQEFDEQFIETVKLINSISNQ